VCVLRWRRTLGVIALVILEHVLLRSHWARRIRRAAEHVSARLEGSGLALDGNPLGSYVLRGIHRGTEVTLSNDASCRLPGGRDDGDSVTGCRITFGAPLPDMIVCRSESADAIMGPMPTVPRVPTGVRDFDSRYLVFRDPATGIPGAAETPGQSAFRVPAAGIWPPMGLLTAFIDLEIHWLRIREGRCELVLPKLAAGDVPRALDLASGIALAAQGVPVAGIKGGPREVQISSPRRSPTRLLVIGWLSVFGIVPFLALSIPFLPCLRSAIEEDVCGVGQTLLVSSTDAGDGTSHGVYCSGDRNASLGMMWLVCFVLSVAIVVGFFAVVALIAFVRSRSSEDDVDWLPPT